tara:strand:- start:1122 stop:1871 length:750 start_codon:yes stop_codon:yes gene_type:complete
MAQTGYGRINIFEDFLGGEDIVANTAATRSYGGSGLRVLGQGISETDSGIVAGETDANNGVGILTTTNEADHSCGVATSQSFVVGKMGTIVAECRVQFPDLDTKEFYFGLSNENEDAENLQGSTIHGETATITLSASNLCGFLLSAELTDDEDWHMVYNGGTTTGETTSTNIDADVDAVAGEYDILRVEVAINGTARWYINGVLKQTVENAISTTEELCVIAMVEAKTAAIEYAWIDYIAIEANRDWTE